jgi:flagellar assembly protein FliH
MQLSSQEKTTKARDVAQSEGPRVGSGRTLSQREYRPTPYVAEEWEIVGEISEERDFIAMTLEVLRDERASADPMFETFASSNDFSNGAEFETPGGVKKKKKAKEEDEPIFDAALFEAELEARYEQGRQAGLKEAEKIAEERIVESYEALAERMKEITGEIKAQVQNHAQELEKRALRLSLGVAKKLVDTTSEAKPEYILSVIRKGLKNLGAAKPLKIKVSAQDYEFLDVIGIPVDISPGEIGVVYQSDENIKSGCVIETDYGQVDLELDSMWEEVKAGLFEVSS